MVASLRGNEFWVFGYGSLMWRPGFPVAEQRSAKVIGYHRKLCIYSYHYRGTPEKPGLVLGLDQGGSCAGLAMKVEASDSPQVLDYLRAREMISDVYFERLAEIEFEGGETAQALTYIANPENEQYVGNLSRDEELSYVRQGTGSVGPNADYVINTCRHLEEMGIEEQGLKWLVDQLEPNS